MKSLLILAGCISAAASPVALANQGISGKHETAVPDSYLARLGTAAPTFLIERLQDPLNEKNYRGVVERLEWESKGMPREDQRIFTGLSRFIGRNMERDEVLPDTEAAMDDAMMIIGSRGGEAGVNYLIEWVTTDKYIKSVRCHDRFTRDPEQFAVRLLKRGVRGLGLSGKPKALEVLKKLKADPPKIRYFNKSVENAIDFAISENLQIQKDGPEKYFFPAPSSNYKPQKPKGP